MFDLKDLLENTCLVYLNIAFPHNRFDKSFQTFQKRSFQIFVTFGCDPVTKWYNVMFQVMIQIIGFTINIAKEMSINFAAVNEK